MNLTEKFTNVSILGAAGKMGSGITVLNALHVSNLMFLPENKGKSFVINAVDQSFELLEKLRIYAKAQVQSYGEKNINRLRSYYAENDMLIENLDIVRQFIQDVLGVIRFTTTVETSFHSHLIFEAITENLDVKAQMLGLIKRNSLVEPLFLTNTSSIPIRVINEKANLGGDIIGCHFYNPPVVQKLIEVIEIDNGNSDLKEVVSSLAGSQRKTLIPSNDVAGFIGNGVFIREMQYALECLNDLSSATSYAEAVLTIDTITRELLLRPMGIFQLIDYVGIDVCSFISGVMDSYLDETIDSSGLDRLLSQDINGGQLSSGVQRDGFFKYEKGKITAVLEFSTNTYIESDRLAGKVKDSYGDFIPEYSWKQLSRDRSKDTKIADHFAKLRKQDSTGCRIAHNYLDTLKGIGRDIVEKGVTDKKEDINSVMILGFYQLYGPINNH